ncbi:DUF1800 family protein [Streptomyces sp. DSM 41982]|uniref:DUF1800 family protein n=1 Tax=Streptomyces evansiae TaxID=3075535 RepID=A0ABD5E1F8_9ACTN|nr:MULTISPECIES: DUF1800 family protein [unclassified Streptomyces]MDT0414508.1 DUF1800 family protein [Streptomyces sp. DSM 41982]SCD52905.1 Uncharacterized conserved protein, DUF1800 family [Streptomyces sp. SolWspMP-sol7th]
MAPTLDSRAHLMRLLQRAGFDARGDAVDAAEKAGFDATLDRLLGAQDADDDSGSVPAPHFGPLPPRTSEAARRKKEGAGAKKREKGKKSPPAAPGDAASSGAPPSPRGTAGASPSPHGTEGTDPRQDPVRKHYREVLRAQRRELTLWWLERMVATAQPWTEKRTLLWHNHWATSIQKVKSGAAMLQQNETLRRLGGGDFRTLARAMVVDPALMVWLDADGSTAKAPNENLGREFMELFVLGVGNYSETDVRQAAAALTGWTLDRQANPWKPVFRAARHAKGPETVVGRTADFTARSLVDHLVALPASHAHVAGRMWGALVSNENKPSASALARLVKAYGTERDTTALFRALFTDAAFADPANVLVKQPVEYVVGSLRALGVRPRDLPEKQRAALLLHTLTGLGQVPFAPDSVGGWPAGAAWLTTSAAQARIGFAQMLVRHADLGEIEKTAAKDRAELLARTLGVGEWGAATRGVLTAAARDPMRITALALTAPEHLVLR